MEEVVTGDVGVVGDVGLVRNVTRGCSFSSLELSSDFLGNVGIDNDFILFFSKDPDVVGKPW